MATKHASMLINAIIGRNYISIQHNAFMVNVYVSMFNIASTIGMEYFCMLYYAVIIRIEYMRIPSHLCRVRFMLPSTQCSLAVVESIRSVVIYLYNEMLLFNIDTVINCCRLVLIV